MVRARFPDATVDAIEIDRGRAEVMRRRFTDDPHVHVRCSSLEELAADVAVLEACWDAVVMNPPFTVPGDRYTWATHLALVWSLLRPGGQLRAIVPVSLEFGRQRAIAAARRLVRDAGGGWLPAPAGSFRAAGTTVHTLVVAATRR